MLITFKVSGMHCSSCATLIKGAVEDLPGITQMELDSKSGKGSLQIDTDLTTTEKVVKTVKDLGYELKLEEENNG